VLTSHLESDRVKHVLPDAEVLDFFELGYKELVKNGMSLANATRETEARAVRQIGIEEAIVPGDFPLALGDRLRKDGVVLTVDDSAVELRRRAKTPVELDGIRTAQRAAEAGMGAACKLLSRAVPAAGGQLEVDGKPLLAEEVRATLRAACAKHGAPCPPDVIVASVWQGGGHEPGSGPLPAGLPIHIDIWPRHEESACWADMARTFMVGDPTAEHADLIAEQVRLAEEALTQTKAAVRPGITGRELYDATCDLFEAAGHATQRTSDGEKDGFQFALGHGVGLEVHEAPSLGLAGHEPLVAGDVLALEPGLWDKRVGGVTFEDLVLVTEDGSELLTEFPYDLTPRGE
jgi:Xaa-Pro aminopeptidase